FSLTEPEAGSDVASLKTTVTRSGDEYILNGEKVFITNANYDDFYVVLAKQTDLNSPKAYTALIVEKNSPGLKVGKNEKKMGLRASNTGSLIFNDVVVPAKN